MGRPEQCGQSRCTLSKLLKSGRLKFSWSASEIGAALRESHVKTNPWADKLLIDMFCALDICTQDGFGIVRAPELELPSIAEAELPVLQRIFKVSPFGDFHSAQLVVFRSNEKKSFVGMFGLNPFVIDAISTLSDSAVCSYYIIHLTCQVQK